MTNEITRYSFQSKGRDCVVTSKKFPEFLGQIISAECWDTDSDLPVIGMSGTATLNDGRKVSLRGTRDVGIRTGYDPHLTIQEATEKRHVTEWEYAGTVSLPVLPYYNSVHKFWSYDPGRSYGGSQWDHEILEEQARQVVKEIEIPKSHKIIETSNGFKWMKLVVSMKDIGLGHPAWVQ